MTTTREVLESLEQKLADLQRERRGSVRGSFVLGAGEESPAYSSGVEALDELLPLHGFRKGSLVEWLSREEGAGAEMLAFLAARAVCRSEDSMGRCVIVDARGDFYPLAVKGLGMDPRELIVIRPKNAKEELWALDQSLRSRGVGAVLGWVERLSDTAFRRLQLGAESSGAMGFLIRPASVQKSPSWAEIRLLVEPVRSMAGGKEVPSLRWGAHEGLMTRPGRHLRIHVLRCPGGNAGTVKEIRVDEETGRVHLVPELVHPAPTARPAGA